jgi:hypothetical protein
MENRFEIIATIDELNQYLNGNVTKTSLIETLQELTEKLKDMNSQKLKSLGLIEQTSKTQEKNGTRSFYDPVADCDYLSYESGYVRRAYKRSCYWTSRLVRSIYQLNKTKQSQHTNEYTGNSYECTERIMIPYPSARLERIAHCTVVYRNNLNKN